MTDLKPVVVKAKVATVAFKSDYYNSLDGFKLHFSMTGRNIICHFLVLKNYFVFLILMTSSSRKTITSARQRIVNMLTSIIESIDI